jgi:UDP-N-acetylmuramoyl-tripeptide--D-alanyl-D-alanine ligase
VETRDLAYIVSACGGELVKGTGQTRVERVCTDSRAVRRGDVFFALPGERFDGHDFLGDAAQQGAAAVVVEESRIQGPKTSVAANGKASGLASRAWDSLPCAVVAVDCTRRALGRLGAAYRNDFTLPVVAVGGSNGKTTTKELIAAVLRQKLATLWSEASFNNDVGVPLTLLRLDKSHQAAVLEVGTNHPGELAPLVKMIRPQIGVVTNIGREHLEFFGDVAGVAAEEGWLAELLPATGRLFVNGDNEWSDHLVRRTPAKFVRVGLNDGSEWRARRIRPDTRGVTFRVDAPDAAFSGEYRINLLGRHQVVNALFALAVGKELGLDRAALQQGLAECQPAKMRLQFYEAGGIRVLDDAYNANADSMAAALETLRELPCKGRRVALLGDMAELGAHSEAAHAEVGRRAAESGVGQLLAVGKMAPVLARGARAAGLNRVMEFPDVDAAVAALNTFLKTGDVVLLKASRATRLERIAEALRAGPNGTKANQNGKRH